MKLPRLPPPHHSLLPQLLARDVNVLRKAAPTLPDGRYLHWEQLRHRPAPEGWSLEDWWAAMRFARERNARPIEAMVRCYGTAFSVVDLATIQRSLHEFDRANVGQTILSALGNADAQVEYQVRQLIEEAISSSEIEGARPTTRELARHMLRENRTPVSRDERMIMNNLRAMERLGELHRSRVTLDLEHLLELHAILGDGALDVDGAAGTLRRITDDVTVSDLEGNIWHCPPDANGLEERVRALLRFANGADSETSEFIHPIIRAIVVHFWLGYEHPFRDGNGRMARALFYYCLLREGYEVAEFLSISGPIDRSPKAYYLAFAHVERDGGDLTYFVLHQLDVMKTALAELLEHLQRRTGRLRRLSAMIASFDALNHRQRSLLEHAIRHPDEGQSIEGHARSHRVHYMTSRTDLADLEQRGLLASRRVQKVKRYYPTPALLESAARRP
jgi:Fic family protein